MKKKMTQIQIQDERGFVLVAALLIMLVLTILGIATTTNTSIELQIAGNDKVHKRTFYEAEGGVMLGTELLEENFSCPAGFTNNLRQPGQPPAAAGGTVYVRNKTLGSAAVMDSATIVGKLADPANTYDAISPWNGVGVAPTQEVGYLYFGGGTSVLPGGALEMAAGYEGKGKSSAQGGVAKVADIYSQFHGLTNSESIILVGWRHLVGTEGSCVP